MDKSSVIFGNKIPEKVVAKAKKGQAKYLKKHGDDRNKTYHLALKPIETLKDLGVENLVLSDKPLEMPKDAVVVGNIRMGFGHYRISIAIASCAKALGYQPVWMDLASSGAAPASARSSAALTVWSRSSCHFSQSRSCRSPT